MDTLKTSTYHYHLPEELIAQKPVEPRDSSRLFLYNKQTNQVEHKHFYNIIDYLTAGDVLVVNNTKVIPARLIGYKAETKAKIEVFLLKRLNLTDWEVLLKPAKKFKANSSVVFSDNLKCSYIGDKEDGVKVVRFEFNGVFEDIINQIGLVPLPHYIHNENYKDLERYNTIYSKINGSSAAPTAGLHFTPELVEKIKQKGIKVV